MSVSPVRDNEVAPRSVTCRDRAQHLTRGAEMAKRICTIDGCEGRAAKRGWCSKHYQRWWKTGDPEVVLRSPRGRALDRFNHYVKRDANGCWIWQGYRDQRGYGRMREKMRAPSEMAHRWSYAYFVGPIPEGLVLDHLCRTPACVNPEHLEPVTNYENVVVRGTTSVSAVNARKTHCVHGHLLSGSNLYMRPNGGQRYCRLCMAARSKEYRERLRK